MITEERVNGLIIEQSKYYQKEASVNTLHEVSFYMTKAGTLTNVVSSGLVTLERKLNSGSYGPATYPFSYAAGDTIYYSFGYSDSVILMGNLILIGKDN